MDLYLRMTEHIGLKTYIFHASSSWRVNASGLGAQAPAIGKEGMWVSVMADSPEK